MKYSLRSLLLLTIVIGLIIAYWQARQRYYRTHFFVSVLDNNGVRLDSFQMRHAIITEKTGSETIFTPWNTEKTAQAVAIETPEYCRLLIETKPSDDGEKKFLGEASIVIVPEQSHQLSVRLKPVWRSFPSKEDPDKTAKSKRLFSGESGDNRTYGGRVVDEQGMPIKKFSLARRFGETVGSGSGVTIRSKPDVVRWEKIENEGGNFWATAPWNGPIVVQADGFAKQMFFSRSLDVRESPNGEKATPVGERIVLHKYVSVVGTVEGKPELLPDIHLSIVAFDASHSDPYYCDDVTVQKDGTFRSDGLRPGGYVVSADYLGQVFFKRPIVVPSIDRGETLEIPKISIPKMGTVRGKTTLKPFELVYLATPGEDRLRIFRVDHRGEFTLEGVTPGLHMLRESTNSNPAPVPYLDLLLGLEQISETPLAAFYVRSGETISMDMEIKRPVLAARTAVPFRAISLQLDGKSVPFEVRSVADGTQLFLMPFFGDWSGNLSSICNVQNSYFGVSCPIRIAAGQEAVEQTLHYRPIRGSIIHKVGEDVPNIAQFINEDRSTINMMCSNACTVIPLMGTVRTRVTSTNVENSFSTGFLSKGLVKKGDPIYFHCEGKGWAVVEARIENGVCEVGSIKLEPGADVFLKLPLDAFDVLPTNATLRDEHGIEVSLSRTPTSTSRYNEDTPEKVLKFSAKHLWPGKWTAVVRGSVPTGETIKLWERDFVIEGTQRVDLSPSK